MSGLIKIVKYQGKRGGFATHETTLYRVDVKGEDNSIRYGNHYAEEKYAVEEANNWRDFTGWPVQRIELKQEYREIEVVVASF
jgi:hypothetical protein